MVGGSTCRGQAPYCLGTDKLGRDMLTRLIYGARNTVGIAFATTALAFVIGGGPRDLGCARRRLDRSGSCRAWSTR